MLKRVLLEGWIDCPRCGRIDRLRNEFDLECLLATPLVLRTPAVCLMCGTHRAALVLERIVPTTH